MGKNASNEVVKKVKNENTSLKKNARDIAKITLILATIAIVAGCLLGVVNHYTFVSDADMLKPVLNKVYADAESYEDKTEDYKAVLDKIDNPAIKNGNVNYVYRAFDKDKKVIENVYIYQVYGSSAYDISLLVAVKDNKILNIEKVESSGTPGIGDRVYKSVKYMFSKETPVNNFLEQYIGADVVALNDSLFSISKSPKKAGEVSPVTGATKSSNAVLNALNCVILAHNAILG